MHCVKFRAALQIKFLALMEILRLCKRSTACLMIWLVGPVPVCYVLSFTAIGSKVACLS
jgi:hypothetical protein